MAVIPYGACVVAEAVKEKGHRVTLLDLMFEQDPVAAVNRALGGASPDVVGISVRNIDDNDMVHPTRYFRELVPLVETIRRRTAAPVVLGGPAVAVMPEALLRYTGADLAVLRDGETVFPRVLEALEQERAAGNLSGTARIQDGVYRAVLHTDCGLENGNLKVPFHRWIDVPKYRSRMATLPIQSKRGCPFECVYCTYGVSEGRIQRLHAPDDVADAVRELAAEGAGDIEFVDSVFNAPYDHALEICESLVRSPAEARLLTMEVNPRFVDERLLRAMELAGFSGIGITAESAADSVLAGLGKGFGEQHVYRTAEAVRRHGIPCFWIFLLGGPGEGPDTVLKTLRFAEGILRRQDVAFFNFGIRIYPGTPLESIAREEGLLSVSPGEMLEPRFYFSPQLEPAWVQDQVHRSTRGRLNMIHTGSLSHPWLPAINRLASRLPISTPLWKHTASIRRLLGLLGRDIPQSGCSTGRSA